MKVLNKLKKHLVVGPLTLAPGVTDVSDKHVSHLNHPQLEALAASGDLVNMDASEEIGALEPKDEEKIGEASDEMDNSEEELEEKAPKKKKGKK